VALKDRVRRIANRAVLAAWAVVQDAGDIVPGTKAGEAFGRLGRGSSIGFPVATLMNPGSMHIGEDVLVGRHVTLSVGYGVHDQRRLPRGLVIGDRSVIGARSSIVAHESIEIGKDVWFGQAVFVSDASHGYQDHERPIGLQFGEHHPVRIGDGCWIGHGAVLLPGTTLGRNVVVAAGAVVRGTVADHAIVGGSPARVLRRFEPGLGWVAPSGDVRPVLPQVAELS
jgi:acetyltransferase-like isoleucine patch superfamily enzyme